MRDRVSRRRALKTAGALGGAGAAAALVGCGSDSSSGDDPGTNEGLLSKPIDRSKDAQPGGIYQGSINAEPTSSDPHVGSGSDMGVAYYTYLRLLKRKTQFDGMAKQEPVGDLAESWEFTADGLQLTLKLRQGVIWDRRAPTSGRPVDAEDVRFSAARFEAKSTYAKDFFQSKSDVAPVTSLTTPDSRTVVMKLAYPYVPLLTALSRNFNMWILPREAEGGFDPRQEVRGAGPWILDKWERSALMSYRRNPDYYEKGRPYFEAWENPVIPEYASRLAQFRAGRIWGNVPNNDDLLPVKRDFPQLDLFQGDFGVVPTPIIFGFDGPFKDVRLRQAVSMVLDRELFADTFSNKEQFEAAGLPVPIRLASHIGAGWPEWMDPRGKEFGPNAKYFDYNVAEARKLMTAAGVNIPLKTKFTVGVRPNVLEEKWAPAIIGLINDSGLFQVEQENVDYSTVFTPTRFYAKGLGWDGMAVVPATQGDDAGQQLQLQYHSQGTTTRQPPGLDPKLDQMIDAQLREADLKKRFALIQDIQRHMVTTMIGVPIGFSTTGFSTSWPWVANAGAVRSAVSGSTPQSEIYPYYWYDKAAHERSKPA